MQNNNILSITLTADEKKLVSDKLKHFHYEVFGNNQYISALRAIAYRYFPQRILDIFEQQKQSINPAACIIFDNVPIDTVFGSPLATETGSMHKSGTLTENILCTFGSLIGEPYSICFEGHELVNNLVPYKENKADYTGLGSAVELDFHIENSALKFMSEDDCSPTGLFLLGIRKDPESDGPKTSVSDARQALDLLAQSDIDILYEKNFTIRLPHRWRSAFSGKGENTGLCPMLSGPRELPRVNAVFYQDMVLPANERARQAFNKLHNAIKEVAVGIHITPGKLVYIDNQFVLHSREKFIPTYDKNHLPYRWVQRIFVTQNLWAFRGFSKIGNRVFDPN